MAGKTHKDVEFAVDDASGKQRIFKTWAEAASFAVVVAASVGPSKLDVLVYSRHGAKWYGGSDAVEQYKEDPDASVFARFEVSVNFVGHVS